MSELDIKLIMDTALAASDKANDSLRLGAEFPALVIPDNFKIHSLDYLNQFKSQFTGTFKTHLIRDFFSYYIRTIEDGEKENVPCFVNIDSIGAAVIFDRGDSKNPGHCKHRAELALKSTPAYVAVCAIAGAVDSDGVGLCFSQRELFNFLNDWNQCVRATDGRGDDMGVKEAAQLILSIEMTETGKKETTVGNASESKSTFDQIEAKASQNRELPRGFMFSCPTYHGLQIRDFFLELSTVMTLKDTPKLKLRCVGFDVVMEEIRQEFAESIESIFKGTPVLVGTFEPGPVHK